MKQSIVTAYQKIGDFLSKLRSITWFAGVVLAGVAGLLFWLTQILNDAQRALLFFWLLIGCLIVITVELIYIVGLRRQRHALEEGNKTSEKHITRLLYIERAWVSLQKSWKRIDEQFARLQRREDIPSRHKLSRAVQTVLFGCLENILRPVDHQSKRSAFLLYDSNLQSFEVLIDIGLVTESFQDVRGRLVNGQGLASKAVRSHDVIFVQDTLAAEALEKGYLRIGSELRHRAIACKAVWVEDKAVGVLCVDSAEPNVFTEADYDLIGFFTEKIRLAFSMFHNDTSETHQW
jgi:hypothetical protein